eukprot:CAMPEP_0180589932 /NCGR_PEP_ID=MMETSP1037_2-20121125/18409_1 /TAXON_ID=632150 /ORGANISM="Azadinium spinosum, Strain 3D9" /LENGTH=598 /DNA_ID=CAMNT_0022608135 /DNA_START=38 /DNA_END=1834 /DNA_ORIENTATION=+
MSGVKPWWRRREWTQSLECKHLCMLLCNRFREQQLGCPCFPSALGARVADFLEPPLPNLAVCCSYDVGLFVKFYNSDKFEFIREIVLPEAGPAVSGVAYSPCGTRLATGDERGVVRLLEIDTLKMKQESIVGDAVRPGPVCLAFAPSGGFLAVGIATSGSIFILSPETLAVLRMVLLDGSPPSFVAFSPSGDSLAVVSLQPKLDFFEPNTLTGLRSVSLRGHGTCVAYHPAGKSLAVIFDDGPDAYEIEIFIQLLDASTVSVLHEVELPRPCYRCGWTYYLMYTPEGGQLMVDHCMQGRFRVYDSGTLDFLHDVDLGLRCHASAFAIAGNFQEQVDEIQQVGQNQPSAVAEVMAPVAPIPSVVASAGEEKEEEPDEGLLEALQRSEEEDLQREGRDVQEALLLSKAEALSADGVVLSRLTYHTQDITALLTNSDDISVPRSRMESANCEMHPSWANGALLLIPVTEEQIIEAGIQLKPHNILMLASDVQLVEHALESLPRRKRPKVKPECHANGNPQPSPADSTDGRSRVDESDPMAPGAWMEEIGLVVERTFLSFQLEKDITEVSTPVQSAPATTGVVPSGHVNPHRWHLLDERDGV